MKKASVIFKPTAFLFMLFFIAGSSGAQNLAIKRIGKTLEIVDDKNQAGTIIENKKFEPSAVEAIGNGEYLLVANDKDNNDGLALKIVEASSGKVIKAFSENIASSKKNPKWEALAKDAEGNYYVIGSHNDENDPAKLAARSRLFRFRLSDEWEKNPMNFAVDMASVKELNIKDSLADLKIYDADMPKSDNAKIEGLAVRGRGCRKEIFIGLRENPLKKNITRIYFAELPDPETAKDITKLSLKPLFEFDAGTSKDSTEHFKLSSLEYVEKLNGFLIVTSTEDSANKFHGNALWFVGDDAITAAKKDATDGFKEISTKNIFEFDPEMKAEGITVLPFADGKIMRVVIVFDNDGIRHGALAFLELTDNRK